MEWFWGTILCLKTREISVNLGLPFGRFQNLGRLGKRDAMKDWTLRPQRGTRPNVRDLSISTSIYKWIWGNKKHSLSTLQLIDPLVKFWCCFRKHFPSLKSLTFLAPTPCPVATFCSGSCLCNGWHSTNISALDLSLHWWAPSVTPQNQFIIPFPTAKFFLVFKFLHVYSIYNALT